MKAGYFIRDSFPGQDPADYGSKHDFIWPGHSLSICIFRLSTYVSFSHLLFHFVNWRLSSVL